MKLIFEDKGQPGKRCPIIGHFCSIGKSPENVFQTQPALNMVIFRNAKIVIVVNEREIFYLPINGSRC